MRRSPRKGLLLRGESQAGTARLSPHLQPLPGLRSRGANPGPLVPPAPEEPREPPRAPSASPQEGRTTRHSVRRRWFRGRGKGREGEPLQSRNPPPPELGTGSRLGEAQFRPELRLSLRDFLEVWGSHAPLGMEWERGPLPADRTHSTEFLGVHGPPPAHSPQACRRPQAPRGLVLLLRDIRRVPATLSPLPRGHGAPRSSGRTPFKPQGHCLHMMEGWQAQAGWAA